jgi:hypothetical protein
MVVVVAHLVIQTVVREMADQATIREVAEADSTIRVAVVVPDHLELHQHCNLRVGPVFGLIYWELDIIGAVAEAVRAIQSGAAVVA